MTQKVLRVCYFGTYRDEYPRNRSMIEGLRRNGVQVIECHEKLWKDTHDRAQAASGAWKSPRFLVRVVRVYIQLLQKYLRIGDYDVMVVGYPGQFDVFLARILTWLQRKPLCWDVLTSIYQISLERRLDQNVTPTIQLIRFIEKLACHLPEQLILESEEYVNWFCQTHRIKPDRFRVVPLGSHYSSITTDSNRSVPQKKKFIVLYWGNFLRSHGVDLIMQAARCLNNDKTIEFICAGDGPERKRAMESAKGLRNISFPGYLSDEALVNEQDRADICLGVFGSTPQAMETIQNRIYECLAKGKVLLTGYAPLISKTFQHGRDLFLCERTVEGIVEAIRILKENPQLRIKLAENGQKTFNENFSVEKIGQRFLKLLLELV